MELLKKRDFMTSPYKSERNKVIKIQRWSVRKFFRLLDKLEDFLKSDKCYRLADNYLIAMVFTYFLRASLEPEEYTKDNFFAALLLAYNMEEDDVEFMLLELGESLECSVAELRRLCALLFRRVDYRGAVSRRCCDIVMRCAKPEHRVWQRRRHAYHSGVIGRKMLFNNGLDEDVCDICAGKSDEAGYESEDVEY